MPIVLKCGSLNLLEPSVPVQGLLQLFTLRFGNWLCFQHHVKVIKRYYFWVYTFCGRCVLRRFGGTYCLRLTLKMEAVGSSETSQHTSTTRYRNRTEDHQLINNRREHLKKLATEFHIVIMNEMEICSEIRRSQGLSHVRHHTARTNGSWVRIFFGAWL